MTVSRALLRIELLESEKKKKRQQRAKMNLSRGGRKATA